MNIPLLRHRCFISLLMALGWMGALSAANARTEPVRTVAEVRARGADVSPSSGPFALRRGEVIGEAIADWARRAGWHLEQPELSWIVPADTEFTGDFQEALSSLITLMVRQGATVQLHLWPANRAALIIRTTP
jgi:hypothetical protein